ncbi:MAG: hypothetical protein MZV64_37010 [Ignavibacteriales bacterium]|nr:hypothetical protein [Ignavibacteriales bacterium]
MPNPWQLLPQRAFHRPACHAVHTGRHPETGSLLRGHPGLFLLRRDTFDACHGGAPLRRLLKTRPARVRQPDGRVPA